MNNRIVEILLIEDNPGDVQLTLEAFKEEMQMANHIHVVNNGASALAFLRGEGTYAQAPQIDVVLLDLNLPGMSGREVLVEMKTDPGLKHIPVVVLSASEDEDDILNAYESHANAYLTKPRRVEDFRGIVQAFEGFWLSVVGLQKNKRRAYGTDNREYSAG